MDKIILNVFKVVSLILIALAVVFQVIVLIKGDDVVTSTSIIDNFITTSIIAFGIAAVLAVIFPIIFIGQNPKNALKLLAVLVGFVVIGFICYSIAGNAFNNVRLEELKTTVNISRIVGAGLYFTYIVGSGAILAILISSLAGLFK